MKTSAKHFGLVVEL